jgi:uncharacterized protein (DUF1786 family)
MRILAVDVGTGTQDVLLFDSELELENCPKLVVPSPTAVIADRIRGATADRRPLVLHGVTMGGGPCAWAANDHLQQGLALYATPDAARTFDDDLAAVARMGVSLVSDDEVGSIRGGVVIEMRDLWFSDLIATFQRFGLGSQLDAVAVAVFDHGAAPPGYSDRTFRFDYLAARLSQRSSLTAFAYRREEIPASLTRLAAAAATAPADLPVLAMDTAPAAVLGALEDPRVWAAPRSIVANVGNFHCLAFRLEGGRIGGLFEHHSGELNSASLRTYVEKLAAGTITNAEVFADMGHGALTLSQPAEPDLPFLAVTGPRRALLVDTGLDPYLAVPHGDMMLAGCFGLLRAFAGHDPALRPEIERRLGPPPSPAAR